MYNNCAFHCTKTFVEWKITLETLCRAGPSGSGRGWATLSATPFVLVTTNNRLKGAQYTYEVHLSNRLLLVTKTKDVADSVTHPLPLALGPALHNLTIISFLGLFSQPKQVRVITYHFCRRVSIIILRGYCTS